jgi:hypothetical protein
VKDVAAAEAGVQATLSATTIMNRRQRSDPSNARRSYASNSDKTLFQRSFNANVIPALPEA